MKNLIVQYYIGDEVPEWAQMSSELFKRYAEKHGAEYEFRSTSEYCKNHYFENLKVVYNDKYLDYNRVLYVDVDVIPENMEENIFDVDIKDVGLVPEYQPIGMDAPPLFSTANFQNLYIHTANMFNVPVVSPKSVRSNYLMMNSGVILWSREGRLKAREKFMDWKDWYNRLKNVSSHMCLDQPFINGQVTKHLDYTEMDLKWNCYPRFRFYKDQIPENINFIHYTGGKKKMIKELHGDLI